MDQLFAYAIAFLISAGMVATSGSSIPVGLTQQAVSKLTQQLTNLGSGYQSGCDATVFTCSVGGVQEIKSGPATVWAGYVNTVPTTTPVGAGSTYQMIVAPSPSNSLTNTVIVYASSPILGDYIQSFPVLTVTTGNPPTVVQSGTPQSGKTYYLVYDKCESGIYASVAVPTTSGCP